VVCGGLVWVRLSDANRVFGWRQGGKLASFGIFFFTPGARATPGCSHGQLVGWWMECSFRVVQLRTSTVSRKSLARAGVCGPFKKLFVDDG